MLSKKAQLRIIYLVAGIGILLIALALAQEPTSSDLSKSYNPVTKEITIKNTILGVPTTEVAKLKLITAQMNFVSPGTDVLIAKIEINSKEEYVLALKQVEFYNKINGVKLTRTLKYKYLSYEDVPIDVPIYKEICDEKNKTCYNIIESYEKGTEKKEVWTDYPNTKTEIGTFTIGIFTDVYQGDYVEWVPTFFDTKIEEWATYVASSLHGQTFNLAETHAIGDGYDRLGSQFTIDFNASLKSVIKTGNASIAWLIGANGSVLASATFNVAGGDQYANFTIPYPLVAGKLYIVTCNNSNTMSSGNVYVNATGALGAYPYINNNVSWVRGYDAGTNSTRLWQVKGIVYTYQQADVTIILNNPKNQNNYTSSSITFNVTATPTAGGMSSCWYTLNGGITNYTMVNISSEYTLINSSITPGSYTSVFYCNNTANSIETTSSTFTRVCAFAGITEDALHNRVPNSKVYMINQNTNNLYNTTSNNSGDWTWNVSIGGNYTVVGIDITNSSRDADADPFILCS